MPAKAPETPRTRLDAAIARVPRWLRVALFAVWAAAALGLGIAAGLLLFRPPVPRPAVPGLGTRKITSASTVTVLATTVPDAAAAPRTELIGFYVNWDEESYRSLRDHIGDITVLMPMWYHLGDDGRLTVDDPAAQARALALVRAERPDLAVMPIVNNYDQAADEWNAPEVAVLLKDPATRRRIAASIVDTLAAAGFQGVNIDFEDFTAASRADLVAFMAELYPLARAKGLTVSQDVLARSDTFDHAALARHSDYLVPMLYSEHWRTSGAGPIASQAWFERMLAEMLAEVPAEKLVLGLGVYGRDYGGSGSSGSLTWTRALADARAHGALIRLDPVALNPTYSYTEGTVRHQAWLLDSAAVFDQVAAASAKKPRGYAIWRMGAEDPVTWTVLRNRDALDERVAAMLRTDRRTVVYDAGRGLIVSSTVTP